jgi:hypothetical protein
MIGTIGSLVQETSNRLRWLLSASLYTAACVGTSLLLGAALAGIGGIARHSTGSLPAGAWLVGILAMAYALSDLGWIPLPRPRLRYAVPITWWRWWRPYWAAIAYGAALGLGVMTRVHFGAFYVLCVWCFLMGNVAYGAVLMGTFGAARAMVIFPASWGWYWHGGLNGTWLESSLFSLQRAQAIVAVVLTMFGTSLLVSSIVTAVHAVH